MTRIFICALLLCASFPALSHAQSSLVYNRLRMIIAGKGDEVRKELPELMKEFPDEPGIMFLNAVLTEDGSRAVTIYEQITREHPQSEWADDAQLRIVQYYALKHDTARAQRELSNFKRNYSLSEFLIHAMDMVKATVGNAAVTAAKSTASTTEKTSAPTKGQRDNLLVESKPTPTDAKVVNDPKSVDRNSGTAESTKKYWGLQVGLFTSKKTAEAEAQKYRDQKMKVDVVSKEGGYSVIVGNYSTRESAEKSRVIIQSQCQCTPYTVEK